jgi:hypothetical protein
MVTLRKVGDVVTQLVKGTAWVTQYWLSTQQSRVRIRLPPQSPESTALDHKDLVFRKTYCSATACWWEILGILLMKRLQKIVLSLSKEHKDRIKLLFRRLVYNVPPISHRQVVPVAEE